ncbi:hypothetical protein [Oligoflexus tunisiensis]|uniref:hypothetical protein n=1 Tax=Oligoflexus tunisiensis TaxID=708132 RepID=UPI00114CC59D|nr:hypothetical protein [Oligoflexus tunisiensis]
MAKKKNNNPSAKTALPGVPPTPRKKATRKPRAKAAANSELKKTILSAPRAVKLEAAKSFMRTTAFTLQNKVRTAMTDLSKIEESSKTPSARLGLSYSSSVQPTSSDSFFSKPFNRFKIAFLTMLLVGGIAGSFYFDRVIEGFKSVGKTVENVASDKTWVEGMLSQPNGVPENNDKDGTLMPPRMMEETVIPVVEEAEAPVAPADTTDVLPTEPMSASETPAAVPVPTEPATPAAKAAAPEVKAKAPKAVKSSKKSKASKGKASKSRKAKAKSKAKASTR